MIHIYIISKDLIWANAFRDYVNNIFSEDYMVYIGDDCGDVNISYDIKNTIYIVDGNSEVSDLISDSNNLKDAIYCNEKNVLFIMDNKVVNDNIYSIYKYVPANMIISRIKMIMGKISSSKKVRQFVFASSITTDLTWKKCNKMAKKLTGEGYKILMISFASFDKNSIDKDTFSKFVYYSSIGSEKLTMHMEELICTNSVGVNMISKPYLFDISQWNKICSVNALNAFDNRDDFDVIIWHMDGIFTQGFIPIYQRCDKFFWTSVFNDYMEDKPLKILSDICQRNLGEI